MKLPITVGYLTIEDARDRRTWSGTHHFLLKELEQRAERVVLLGPLAEPFAVKVCKVLNQLGLRLLGKRFNYRASPWVARSYARAVEAKLARRSVDLIIAPAGLATAAYLRASVPIVYVNDRSIAGALGYHDILTDLFTWSKEQSLATERAALHNASLSVFSSAWAAEAAKRAAPEVADRVRMIPFGANLPVAPEAIGRGSLHSGTLKLLFLGVNWVEKGGPIAYDTLLQLKQRGVAAQLLVCGCEPPPHLNDPDLVREGFLDKNKPGDLARLQEHLRTADLLLLPTRFEAYGIVFCEAAAYGLPVLATRTGGIPTVVQDGVTGILFDANENGADIAQRVQLLLADGDRLTLMRKQARARFETVLNWPAFVDALLDQAAPLVPSNKLR